MLECPLLAISRLYRLIRGTSALPPKADIGPTYCGIRVERRIEIDQVNALGRDAVAESLPMAGYTQATTPVSLARSRASLDPEGRFQILIVVLHGVLQSPEWQEFMN